MVPSVMFKFILNLFALACSRFCKTHAVNKSWAWHDTLLSLSMRSMLLLLQGSTQEQVVTCHTYHISEHAAMECGITRTSYVLSVITLVHVLDISHHLLDQRRWGSHCWDLLGQEIQIVL
jgi:hypothetical protein